VKHEEEKEKYRIWRE